MELSFENLQSENRPRDYITKEKILENYSQEELFERYSGEQISNESFCSKLRVDNKPGCNWKYSESGTLYHVDWAKGEYLDVFDYVGKMFNTSFIDSLKQIGHDCGIINNMDIQREPVVPKASEKVKEASKQMAKIIFERRDWSQEDADYWSSYHITSKTLSNHNVVPVKNAWINDNLWYVNTPKDPCYAYGFRNCSQIKLYRPLTLNSSLKWRNNSDAAQGWEYMFKKHMHKKLNPLVITKSLKDVMVLNSLGIQSIAPQGEGYLMDEDWIELLRPMFDDIYVLFDNDLAGVKGMQKYKNTYGIKPLMFPRYLGKDASDIVKKLNKEEFEELFNISINDDWNKIINYLKTKLC